MNRDTTGKHLVEHWTWAAEKGLMNRNSAYALRSACSKVLEAVEDWESIDVSSLDLDDVVNRFKNLKARQYKPESLNAYGKRFRNAVDSFLDYVRDPGAWKSSSRPIQPRSGATQEKRKLAAPSSDRATREEKVDAEPAPPLGRGLIDYPFPLRDGLTVRLMLPRDITQTEVKRLNAFMGTLAVDFDN